MTLLSVWNFIQTYGPWVTGIISAASAAAAVAPPPGANAGPVIKFIDSVIDVLALITPNAKKHQG